VVTWPIGDARYSREWLAALDEKRLPWFRDLDDGVRFMRWLYDLASYVATSEARQQKDAVTQPSPVAAAEGWSATSPRNLTEHESKDLLAQFGVAVTRERVCRSEDEAVLAARSLGFPVALKASSAELLHKTEANAIRLNVESDAAVRQAFHELSVHGEVLVQEMVSGGVELIAGIKNDASFGPTVLFGLGGIFVEALQDVAVRLAPIDKPAALDMIHDIRGFAMLEGLRGRPAANLEAIADTLVALSVMAVQMEEHIQEVDINPLIAGPDGCVAVDALVVLGAARK
ncbi:MAG: acetate--CoA ligase family protein, partial [Chloroflexota bacterium]